MDWFGRLAALARRSALSIRHHVNTLGSSLATAKQLSIVQAGTGGGESKKFVFLNLLPQSLTRIS
jgi:hypothetical protein